MRCSYTKPGKKRCRANALSGETLCYFHSQPGRAAEMGSKGGKRRAIFRAENLKHFSPPTTPAELADIVSQTVVDCRAGRIDAKVTNAISGAATCLLGILRAGESLEQRMENIEKFLSTLEGRNVGHTRTH